MKSSYKILFFSDFNFFAGCENMVSVLINNAKLQKKFSIHLMTRNKDWYTSKKENKYFKFTQIKKKKDIPTKSYFIKIKIIFNELMNFIFICIQLIKLLSKEKFDIIHINSGGYLPNSGTFAILFVATFFKSKIYLVVNNIPQSVGIKKYFKIFFNYFVRLNVSIIISGSKFTSLRIKDFIGFRSDRVKYIRNAINCCERNNNLAQPIIIPNETFIFGSSGHLEERKGHILLLKAFYKLISDKKYFNKNFLLLLEGNDVDQREILLEFINEKKLDKKVILLGRVNNICNFYETINCLVMPSINGEDLPNTIGESQRHSKPVITSDFGGISELIYDGYNGFIFNSGSIDSLFEKMKLIVDSSDIDKMNENARNIYSTQLHEEKTIENYLDVYNF